MSNWIDVVALEQIPVLGSRVVNSGELKIAVFRGSDDQVYAIRDACPHKQGPLSQGMMHGNSVTCPLHNWKIDLTSGKALGADEGCANLFPVRIEAGTVQLQLTPEPLAE